MICALLSRGLTYVIEIQEKDEGQKSIGIMIEISPNLVKNINLHNLKKNTRPPKN